MMTASLPMLSDLCPDVIDRAGTRTVYYAEAWSHSEVDALLSRVQKRIKRAKSNSDK